MSDEANPGSPRDLARLAHDVNNALVGVIGRLDLLARELELPVIDRERVRSGIREARASAVLLAQRVQQIERSLREQAPQQTPAQGPAASRPARSPLAMLFGLWPDLRSPLHGGLLAAGWRVRVFDHAERAMLALRDEPADALIGETASNGISPDEIGRIAATFAPGAPVLLLSGREGPVDPARRWEKLVLLPRQTAPTALLRQLDGLLPDSVRAVLRPLQLPGDVGLPSTEPAARALVVEDEPVLAEILCELTRACGIECEIAHGVDAACAALDARSYAYVILDLSLADGDGRAVARHSRNRWPGTPVLLVTGCPQLLRDSELEAVGVDYVLAKPVRIWQMREALRHAALIRAQRNA